MRWHLNVHRLNELIDVSLFKVEKRDGELKESGELQQFVIDLDEFHRWLAWNKTLFNDNFHSNLR